MKKLTFILALTLISCGSVKKRKENVSVDKKIETTTNTEKEKQTDTKELNEVLEPIDSTKPMIIYRNGRIDTIYNTRVINNYVEKRVKEVEQVNENKKEDEKIDVSSKYKETDNSQIWLYIIIGAVLVFLLKK